MYTKIQKQLLLVSLFLLTGIMTGWAKKNNDTERKKEYTKIYSIDKTNLLKVDNTFGNIDIVLWDKNKVQVHTVVTVKADNENEADDAMQLVSVQINQSGKIISVSGKYNKKNGGNNSDEPHIEINHTLLIPAYLRIKLTQRFGNITLPETFDGQSDINIYFSTLKGGAFTSPLTVDAAFSKVFLGDLDQASLKLTHSDKVSIENGKNIEIYSQFCNIKGNHIRLLKLNSQHGDASFKQCDEGTVVMKFGNLEFGSLQKILDINNIQHSNLKVNNVNPHFTGINAKASFSTIQIKLPQGIGFQLDATTSFGDIRLDNRFQLESNERIKKSNNISVKGIVRGDGQGKIIFDGEFSQLNIK